MAAALVGLYFSHQVDEVAKLGDAAKLLDFKDHAWRGIFWVSLPPGILFVLGSFMVAESPRWLYRKGRTEAARAALLRSRSDEQAAVEMRKWRRRRRRKRQNPPPAARRDGNRCGIANTSFPLCWPV
jgi:MFS transporter, SP family, solute carrier family 2 (myo-inositol transporter), member 13